MVGEDSRLRFIRDEMPKVNLSMLNVAQGANFVSRYDLCILKPHHNEIHEQGVFKLVKLFAGFGNDT